MPKPVPQSVESRVFADADDPQALLQQGLHQCGREELEAEIASIDTESARARELGDAELLRELQLRKVQIRKRQAELHDLQYRA